MKKFRAGGTLCARGAEGRGGEEGRSAAQVPRGKVGRCTITWKLQVKGRVALCIHIREVTAALLWSSGRKALRNE